MTRDLRSLDTLALAKKLIGSEQGLQRWLDTGHPNLGWRKPANVIGSGPEGEVQVRDLLLDTLRRLNMAPK